MNLNIIVAAADHQCRWETCKHWNVFWLEVLQHSPASAGCAISRLLSFRRKATLLKPSILWCDNDRSGIEIQKLFQPKRSKWPEIRVKSLRDAVPSTFSDAIGCACMARVPLSDGVTAKVIRRACGISWSCTCRFRRAASTATFWSMSPWLESSPSPAPSPAPSHCPCSPPRRRVLLVQSVGSVGPQRTHTGLHRDTHGSDYRYTD